MKKERITEEDFERMFDCGKNDFPPGFSSRLATVNTVYREAEREDIEEYTLDLLKRIQSPQITRTKEENLQAFEKGWGENLEALKIKGVTSESLKPGYFRPSNYLRYRKNLIIPDNPHIEYDLFNLAREVIFTKYLSPYETICEIGCGSCQNLFMLSELYPEKKLIGLDWTLSSSEIAGLLSKTLKRDIEGHLFDMMEPESDLSIKPAGAIITIHAMEQVGTNYGNLLSFILNAKPAIVLHYEPILDFYDENNLLDFLALSYCKKRNYLSGYLTALKALEKEGEIEIIEARRPYLGGVVHEASLVIWRPKG
ncbi:MAG: class I SAM-dependent methyltransferase [Deltaproteobacteria bacterium]|nr:class I SAM-dependent methyltransferase [Deltaproteobacteria bacterium]